MKLSEVTRVPDSALPVQTLKDHLRIGSGFSDDGMQSELISSYLRAAIGVIEGRTGKALLSRRFLLQLDDWRERSDGQALPLAPITSVVSVTLVRGADAPITVPPSVWRLIPDAARPRLVGRPSLPVVPDGGAVEIVFDAGFGADWSDLPQDLAQAILLLAAEFYEQRHAGGQAGSALPMMVQTLIEPWRKVRVLGGGAA